MKKRKKKTLAYYTRMNKRVKRHYASTLLMDAIEHVDLAIMENVHEDALSIIEDELSEYGVSDEDIILDVANEIRDEAIETLYRLLKAEMKKTKKGVK